MSDDVLDPFSAAETVAQTILDQVLQEGGKLLYDSYIARKSFSFAAEAACEVLVGELKMYFVSHDQGEGTQLPLRPPSLCRPATGSKADPQRSAEDDVSGARGAVEALPRPGSAPAATNQRLAAALPNTGAADADRNRSDDLPELSKEASGDGWSLESEPARCRIDTWARACVPVRKITRSKIAAVIHDETKKGHASNGSVSVPSSSRSPSRFGTHTVAEGAEAPKPAARNQMIPLVDERQEDEEEMMLRDMKEREARKLREEQVRTERKAAEEEAAKLSQVKDDKNKQFTYDSDGNLLAVQPPQVHRLPNQNPSLTFMCKEDASQEPGPADKKPARGRDKGGKSRRKDSVEFKDGFNKFLSQQPSMMEAMAMSPGVELEERSRTKRGDKVKGDATMSRKEYEEIARSGDRGPFPSKGGAVTAKTKPTAAPSNLGSAAAVPVSDEQVGEVREETGSEMKIQRAEMGADMVKAPSAPKAPRPLQPSPPSSVKRVHSKRDALGYVLSARERLRINAGSRFPDCAPQPPLGATMGHGLVPSATKQDYYFPGAARPLEMEELPELPEPPLRTPRVEGQIFSQNAQLKQRLFQGR